jgi:hypothetical protein
MNGPAADLILPEVLQLLAAAADELRRHVGRAGTCPLCRCAWPCERALLAERTLGWW